MITVMNSVVVSLIVALCLVLSSRASQLRGNILRYDAELQGDVFTSAVLDEQTGALYVSAGASSVHRLSASLRPEARYALNTQSPVCEDDHYGCRLCLNGTVATTADDLTDVNVTAVVRLDSTSGQLLACGGRCGHCSVLNISADEEPDQHLQELDPDSPASYTASRILGRSPVMVFSVQNTTDQQKNVTQMSKLFVAGATASGLEAVSVRERTPAATAFDVVGARFFSSETFGDSYQFVDALDAGDGFVYFVAVRRYGRASLVETRLVRVCRDDAGRLDSYAEVKLSCLVHTSESLNVAVTAHVAPVGTYLARRFQLQAGEPAIYLVAERKKQRNTEDGRDRWTSGVCVYTMRQVRKADLLFAGRWYNGSVSDISPRMAFQGNASSRSRANQNYSIE